MADTDVCSLILGILPEHAPETECFWHGVEIFRQRHKEILKQFEGKFSLIGLMMLGKQLHQKKFQELAASENTESEEENDDETNETKETTRTPEGTADVMEGIIRHGAHLIRRSRWFCLLSEASLAWKTGETSGENRRLLVFQGGSVLRQEDVAPDAPIPTPPGFQKTFAARQHNFDLITYDRMRVLTTELRRITADETDRQVQLRLSPKVLLERQLLLNLLKWV
jgi:DNA polymerase-3 subunit epsilon